jgi:PAS domain S-box-containing protein
MKSRLSAQNNKYLTTFVIAIILTIISGWLLTNLLGRVAENEFKEKVDREANLTVSFLHEQLGDVENAANVLSQSEEFDAGLFSGGPVDLERANRLLDRVNSSMKLSVCYLLDRNGLAVASSNRKEKTSFVGKSYAFRPFFSEALAGRLTTYFALGLITRERGYFAAAPVVGSSGTITGVVVVKRNIALVGEFFRKYTHASLVSPDGIIFISSNRDHLYRSLWPVDEERRSKLLSSQQFGNITFDPLLASEPRTGTYVRYDNEKHYVIRLPFGSDGWSLVLFDDPHIVSTYRLFGIVLTVVFGLLLLLFYSLLLYKNRSLEAARDLLKSKDDWKRTFDAVPDLIAIIDANCHITSINRAMAERLSISKQDVIGRHCFELLHGSQEPPPSCPHQKMILSGKIESDALFSINLDGYFNVTAAPILAKDGTIESSVYVMHDISDLKKLEQSQKEYAQRLEFVLEGSSDATWEWDMITSQGFLNTRFYEMIEYTPGEVDITFAFFLKTIHPDDVADVQRRVQDYLEGKTDRYEAHYRMVTKSGKLKNVMGRGKIVRYDEGGRPLKMAGVITDVSEMKRLSDEVNRISNLESIGLLSGGLAHDFNNVLNIIYGNISFVKMLAEGNATFVEPLTDAEEACERAKELGIRLQAFSRGSVPFREPIALPALIEDAAGALFKGSHISHSIIEADDVLPVEADSRQIRQVFENLLANAKEAMPDGGTVKIDIENCAINGREGLYLGSGSYIRIALEDDGKGISVENLPKIFDPYFSTKDTYSQRGMGLGLSICHAIMKRHNGQISVASTVEAGTTVTLYLPASVEENHLTPEGNHR